MPGGPPAAVSRAERPSEREVVSRGTALVSNDQIVTASASYAARPGSGSPWVASSGQRGPGRTFGPQSSGGQPMLKWALCQVLFRYY